MTPKQFIYLARPHTIPASIAPILVALVHAYLVNGHNFQWVIAILAPLVGISAQALSNVVNDYYDFRKGADQPNRVGFKRILSSGDVSIGEVRVAAFVWLLIALIAGVWLILITTPYLLIIGALVIITAWAYTGGPKPLAYIGAGEVAVLTFYGWVAYLTTYYMQCQTIDMYAFALSTAMGLASVNILLVNNIRDYQSDKSCGKRTIIVRLGQEFGAKLYLSNLLLIFLLTLSIGSIWSILLTIALIILMLPKYKKLQNPEAHDLNKVLSQTALGVIILALVIVIALIIHFLL